MEPIQQFRQTVHEQIESHVERLDLPQEDATLAQELYNQYITQENAFSRPEEMFGLGAIYAVVRIKGYGLTLQDINTDHDPDNLMKVFQRIARDLDLDTSPQDPAVFVDRITAAIAGVDGTIGALAKDIIADCPNATTGKRPAAVAAGAYYLASKLIGNKINQQLIADAANVSTLTIRNRYQELESNLPVELMDNIS